MKHRFVIGFTIILFLFFLFLKAEWWFFLLLIFCFLFVTFLGVANLDFNYFLKSFSWNSNSKEKKIALTFDDGPTESTPKFLDILKEKNLKATFFCIGKNIEKHPEIFQRIIAEGHEIGNHSYSHSKKIGFFSTKKMIFEIEENDRVIQEFGNISTTFYRPPFGITNPNIAKAINLTDKKSIGWNIRSFDTAIKNEQKIAKRVLSKIKPGSVILMHDTSKKSLKALEQILLFLERENYETVTVSHIFKLN